MTPIQRLARLARLLGAVTALMAAVALGSAAVAGGAPYDECMTTTVIDRLECTDPAAGEAESATTTLLPPGDPFNPNVPMEPPISIG